MLCGISAFAGSSVSDTKLSLWLLNSRFMSLGFDNGLPFEGRSYNQRSA